MNTNGGFFKGTALPVIVLALSVFAVYYPALGYGFVYDDSELILGNRWVLSFSNIPEAFSTHTFGFREEGYQAISYRPLLFVIYMAEYALFGFEPWGWHLVNVTAHAVNAALVFFILRQAVGGEGRGYAAIMPAFAGALIFALHPMNAESVSWLATMAELTFTFLCLAAFYIEARRTDATACGAFERAASRVLPALFFLCALLLKETAVVLPVIVFAYQAARVGLKNLLSTASTVSRYLPYAAASVVYGGMRVYALKGEVTPMATLHSFLSPYEFALNAVVLLARYFKALVLPFGEPPLQLMDPVFSLMEPRAALCALVVVAVPVVLAVTLRRITRLWLLTLAIVILPILPTLYSPAISRFPFADRYLYFPTVGLAMLISIVLAWASSRSKVWGRAGIAIALVAALPAAGLARQKSAPWASDLTLWSAALEFQSANYVAIHSVGAARMTEGRFQEAVSLLERSLQLNISSSHPDPSMVILTRKALSLAALKAGMFDRAESYHESYLELVPEDAQYLYNLAVLKHRRGAFNEAAELYERSALYSRQPDLSKMALSGQSECFLALGRRAEALDKLREALKYAPTDAFILGKVRELEAGAL
ncbi:MAG: tetratricopeptide repeat protein [Deltaproteobacteria bacterium]|nr:tetratricopeptide repeat protein [Deltaproteobacteria bacterium]